MLFNDAVLVIGGRNSPYQPNSKYYTLHILGTAGKWKLNEPHELSDYMEPRWRHSATSAKINGKHIHGQIKISTFAANF